MLNSELPFIAQHINNVFAWK